MILMEKNSWTRRIYSEVPRDEKNPKVRLINEKEIK